MQSGALDSTGSTGWKGEPWMERGALDGKGSTGWKEAHWVEKVALDGKGSTGWKEEHRMEKGALDGKGSTGWKIILRLKQILQVLNIIGHVRGIFFNCDIICSNIYQSAALAGHCTNKSGRLYNCQVSWGHL